MTIDQAKLEQLFARFEHDLRELGIEAPRAIYFSSEDSRKIKFAMGASFTKQTTSEIYMEIYGMRIMP